jgi:cobalt-zinc-cadmium efflux system membrane fusion protein
MKKALWLAALVSVVSLGCSKGRGGSNEQPKEAQPHVANRSHDEKGHADGDEHGEGAEQIVLTPEQVKSVGIATAAVERRPDTGHIRATATIEPAADRQARVGSRIQGRIAALRAGVGDRVRKGQTLAVIDSPELGRAWADFISALAGANVAREAADREKALFEKRISAEREWRAAEAEAVKASAEKEAAENRLHALGITDAELPEATSVKGHLGSTMSLVSPIDGIVVERDATLGQIVDPSQTLFVVMDLRRVWILVEVYEQDLGEVREGLKATVQIAAAPGREFSGTVENVGAVVDPKTRTTKVRVALDNPGVLKPGMFATVRLEGTSSREERHGLFAPAAAVQRMGAERVVFVARGDNGFEPREVKVSRESGQWVEIEEGVSEGEVVVTSGSFALKSELQKDEMGEGHAH